MSEVTPKTQDDVIELAHYWLNSDTDKEPELFVCYLVENCGLDRRMVKIALASVWPEASRCVWLDHEVKQGFRDKP